MAYKFNPLTGKLDDYGPVLTGTGTVSAAADGTAALPGIAFTNDLNTGIYRPGADQVAISTGGTGRLFIRADGGVAVNTAVSPLDVGIQFAVGGPIGLFPYTQNVVGTSNVTFRSALGSASNEDFIKHEITNINNGANYGTALSFLTRTSTAALERLRITSAGLVGIGTVSPAYGLEVNNQNIAITNRPSTGTSNPVLYLRRNVESGDASAVATHGSLVFQTDYAANGVFATSSSILAGSTTGDSVNTYFAFSTTNSGGTLDERLRIDGSGRVGIGTASPSTALHVVNPTGQALFEGSVQGGITIQKAGTLGINLYSDAAGTLVFYNLNGNTERARIDSSGYMRLASGTGGIQFNGDTAAANALDDYEEGTFTPTVTGSTTAGTATYSAQVGNYTKIGRQVNFTIYIVWSGGTGTGELRITGLPFAVANLNSWAVSIGIADNVATAANTTMMAYAVQNGSYVACRDQVIGGGGNTATTYDAAGTLLITGSYAA